VLCRSEYSQNVLGEPSGSKSSEDSPSFGVRFNLFIVYIMAVSVDRPVAFIDWCT
jgi:hypothetical protein